MKVYVTGQVVDTGKFLSTKTGKEVNTIKVFDGERSIIEVCDYQGEPLQIGEYTENIPVNVILTKKGSIFVLHNNR